MHDFPPVTVIIPSLEGRETLPACLESLQGIAYPRDRLRIHVVDNGSRDGSVQWLRARHPEVRVTAWPVNRGFAAAVNHAVREADTPYVAFLNNDTRVDPRWLQELLIPLMRGEAVAAGAKILDWRGERPLFVGGGCNFHGLGFQTGLHDAGRAADGASGEILFACGAAMAIRRDRFLAVGGFDEDFFAFYEDVDLGWRLWVLGERVLFVPSSVVYHRHSATARRLPVHQLRVLHVRNPLLMILKNYERSTLEKVLGPALLLMAQRAAMQLLLPREEFRLGGPLPAPRWRWGRNARREAAVPKVLLSDLVALEDVARLWERLWAKREEIQAARRRSDREVAPLFRAPLWPAESAPAYRRFQELLVRAFGLAELFSPVDTPASGP